MKCLSYGATITSVLIPNRGVFDEVTLCYRNEETLNELIGKTGPYYGCIVGRVANRIKDGKFNLEGKNYKLAVNNGKNHLHGGITGFDKKVWNWELISPNDDQAGFKFTYFSKDNEEGYPGNMKIEVYYLINCDLDLTMRFVAETDQSTPVNITNHTYWNLSGNCIESIQSHRLHIPSSFYLPVDENQIPTGEIKSVEGSPFDFRQNGGKLLSEAIPCIDGGGRPGLDHTFVIEGEENSTQLNFNRLDKISKTYALKHVLTLKSEISGIELSLSASQPGVQIYTANWLPPSENSIHRQHNAICFETQHFPDSVNQPSFPSCILRPGEVYDYVAKYSFSNILY